MSTITPAGQRVYRRGRRHWLFPAPAKAEVKVMAHVEDVRFCFVHGYAHESGEMDSAPEWEPYCREEDWPSVAVVEADDVTVLSDEKAEPRGPFYTLISGDLAYIETLQSGLVPCKVLAINDEGAVTVRVTANRVGWKRGDTEVLLNPRMSLVKRTQVKTVGGKFRIVGQTRFAPDVQSSER